MAVNTKAIKGRIKSVTNTKKITKAMEMVAAAKMRRSVEAALKTREYATIAKSLLDRFSSLDKEVSPILETRPVQKVLAILVSSNRGLCGSFNSNLFKKATQLLSDKKNLAAHRTDDSPDTDAQTELSIDILGIGKKSAIFAKRENYNLIGVHDHLGDKPDLDDVLPISGKIISDFKNKAYDKVVVIYTNYVNSLTQAPKVRQLLPISALDLEKMIEEIGKDVEQKGEAVPETTALESYIFEPDLHSIIEFVLPRLVETQLYQAVLESAASEHSARMLAMKNASENAGEIIKELTLSYNKARQAAITQEISEIAGGAAALG